MKLLKKKPKSKVKKSAAHLHLEQNRRKAKEALEKWEKQATKKK